MNPNAAATGMAAIGLLLAAHEKATHSVIRNDKVTETISHAASASSPIALSEVPSFIPALRLSRLKFYRDQVVTGNELLN